MQHLQIQIDRTVYYLWNLRLCRHPGRIKPDILCRYIKIHQLDLTNPQNDPHRYQQHCEDPLDHKCSLWVIHICFFLSALLQSS